MRKIEINATGSAEAVQTYKTKTMKTIKILTPAGIVNVQVNDNTNVEQLTKELIDKYGTFIQI